jgi:hypothetical protein
MTRDFTEPLKPDEQDKTKLWVKKVVTFDVIWRELFFLLLLLTRDFIDPLGPDQQKTQDQILGEAGSLLLLFLNCIVHVMKIL